MEPYLRFGQALEPLLPGEQRNFADCVLRRNGDWYELCFTDAEGCRPLWPYAPKARYMVQKSCWHVRQGRAEFLVSESPVLELLFELRGYLLAGPPSREAVCLDIGPGASGLFGLYCAASGVRKVVFAEADTRALDRVRANIAWNKFTRCACVHAAVCGESGQVEFRQDADINASALLRGNEQDFPVGRVVQVQAVRLVDLFADLQLAARQPVLCKLDIEGAETELVADFEELVCRHPKCVFAIASYHPAPEGDSASVLEKSLLDAADVCCKTVFKAHKTTFVCHQSNTSVRGILGKY